MSPSKSRPDECRSSQGLPQTPLMKRSRKRRKSPRGRGVDAILTASPYYNKPTQEGQYRHFRAIAEAVGQAHDSLQRTREHGRQSRSRPH